MHKNEQPPSADELQELCGRLLETQDQERRRLARELHDVTGQNLAAVCLNLAILDRSNALPADLRRLIATCQALCQDTANDIRMLSYLMLPPTEEPSGLRQALTRHVEGFRKRSGIHVVLEIKPEIQRFSFAIEMDLFRVVQECLTHILRQGHETAVIRLERRDTQLVLEFEDIENKEGGAPANPERPSQTGGFAAGVHAMQDRLRQHGGSLEFRRSSHGTALIAVIPFPTAAFSAKLAGKRVGRAG
jgi:signal transduction histidine kinase